MPLLDPRRLGVLLDRVLRPRQALLNAQEAAFDATRGVTERHTVEREVSTLNTAASSHR